MIFVIDISGNIIDRADDSMVLHNPRNGVYTVQGADSETARKLADIVSPKTIKSREQLRAELDTADARKIAEIVKGLL